MPLNYYGRGGKLIRGNVKPPVVDILMIKDNLMGPVDPWAAGWQLYGTVLEFKRQLPNATVHVDGVYIPLDPIFDGPPPPYDSRYPDSLYKGTRRRR